MRAPNYLGQVVSSQDGVHCYLPGHVQREDVPHPLHLVDDSVGVGHGLASGCLGFISALVSPLFAEPQAQRDVSSSVRISTEHEK